MALINCPECSKEISDKSKSCISCGYPLIYRNKYDGDFEQVKSMTNQFINKFDKVDIEKNSFLTNHKLSKIGFIFGVVSFFFGFIYIIPLVGIAINGVALHRFDENIHTKKWQPFTGLILCIIYFVLQVGLAA